MTNSTVQDDHNPIDTRLKISALWTAMLFIFAYVDLFSLFRSDRRADIASGKISGFEINQTYLFLVTLYIIIPSLMIYLTLVLRPRLSRIINIVVAVIYAITILGSAVGDWSYFILGSVVEATLLAVVVYHAWTWPDRAST
jgi:cbb3-type cytochrome oxidase subunit 3